MSDADATRRAGGARVAEGSPRRRQPKATLAQVERLSEANGDRFGRFVVLEKLGAGGMGVVLAAYDPDLDRKVAIKVLRPDGLLARTELREQMIREAQAMARLNHPNVVTVHEVGTIERVFFLVMELVDGPTLKDWLAAPRPWREAVRVMTAAGRGLAAAHASGLVHRDFKPHNVLVGRDGRVRVTDFGVVGVAGQEDSFAVGTPAYMAPEQHAPEVIDARADQFAFCATLFEALYGHPAYVCATPEEYQLATFAGPPPIPAGSGVPARIGALIQRGMATDPGARFASMDELLAELERDPRRTARRVGVGAALASLAAVAVIGWSRPPSKHVQPVLVDPCTQDATIGWTPEMRAKIEKAFTSASPALASETLDRVSARVDRYAAAWRATRSSVCASRAIADTGNAPLACLERRRQRLDALTAVLADADDEIVEHAVAAVSSMAPPQSCRTIASPAMVSAPHDADDPRLDRARALLAAGLASEAADIAQAVLATPALPRAREAAASLLLGLAHSELGDAMPAEEALLRAIKVGSSVALDDIVATAYAELPWVVSYYAGRPGDALALLTFAEAAIARAGDPAQLRAMTAFARGSALTELGRYAEAMVHLDRAREIWRTELDPTHPAAARPLLTISNVLGYQGDTTSAEEAVREVIALRESSLGPHHPSLAGPLGNLGGLLIERGAPADALALCNRALSIVDPDGPAATSPRAHLLQCIGRAAWRLGDFTTGERALGEALQLSQGGPNGRIAYALVELGELAAARGDAERAFEMCDRAATEFARPHRGEDGEHPDLGMALACRGRALLARNRLAAARADLEHALRLDAKAAGSSPLRAGELRFALARTYRALAIEPEQRRALATDAATAFARAHADDRAGEVSAFLADGD